jgi:hypothetical protein
MTGKLLRRYEDCHQPNANTLQPIPRVKETWINKKNDRKTQLRYPGHLQSTTTEHRKSIVFNKHFVN